MALQEKHRNTIYTEFRKTLSEEATQALSSQLPDRDVDEAITKADLDLGLAAITGLPTLFT